MIRKITFKDKKNEFPSHLSFFGKEIDLDHSMIFVVGENGIGKSTLLELIALKLKLFRIHQEGNIQHDLSLPLIEVLSDFQMTYQTKPQGIFFGAEDFTSYMHYLEQEKINAQKELRIIEQTYQNKSTFSKQQASMPFKRTLHEINHLHENDLLRSSHGEAYLDFFKSRIRPNYVYLLDEPETPLSIQNQLALMLIIKDAIAQGCQFIIATHSPILTAYPDAWIYEMTEDDFIKTTYDQLDFVFMTKDFLNHKDQYLRRLFNENKEES